MVADIWLAQPESVDGASRRAAWPPPARAAGPDLGGLNPPGVSTSNPTRRDG